MTPQPSARSVCPLCGEPRDQHVPGPPDPPGPDAACLLRDPVRRIPHRRAQPARSKRVFAAIGREIALTLYGAAPVLAIVALAYLAAEWLS